jgi:alpha 1,2-mannosyltransferase
MKINNILSDIASVPPYPGGEGRGIVTTGNLRYAPFLYQMIHTLRYHGCQLPVEVWHTRYEVGVKLFRLFEQFKPGLQFRMLEQNEYPCGYVAKSAAIRSSGFREVLFLDCDNYPAKDPTHLFDSPQFREYGAIIWPDVELCWEGKNNKHPKYQPFREKLGLPRIAVENESGQAVIDRERRWKAVHALAVLNHHAGFVYDHMLGDKETIRLCFELTGEPFFQVPTPPKHEQNPETPGSILQHGLDGEPLFHHRASGPGKFTFAYEYRTPALPRKYADEIMQTFYKTMA